MLKTSLRQQVAVLQCNEAKEFLIFYGIEIQNLIIIQLDCIKHPLAFSPPLFPRS